MKISKFGLDLIKHFEGLYLKAYKCPAGVWTIGYGHTAKVYEGMEITQDQAEEILMKDMEKYEKFVNDLIIVPLSQNQFDALASFTFNCGGGALERSTLRKLLNQKNYDAVPSELLKWNKGGGKVLAGLTRRRKAEGHLWTTGALKFNF